MSEIYHPSRGVEVALPRRPLDPIVVLFGLPALLQVLFSGVIVTNRRPRLARTLVRRAGLVAAVAAALTAFGTAGAHAAPNPDIKTPDANSSVDLLGQLTQLPIIRDLLPKPGTGNGRTGCDRVIQIGDSTSVGVDDAARVPTPGDRLTAQYQRVGARTVTLDALGGRSIVERVNGEPNAADATAAHLAKGERGCWVIAMGVNDAANIAVGSRVNADQRIDRIMTQLRGQPVLWPTVSTTPAASNKAYNAAAMRGFNDALRRATSRYPNLAVYDWAAHANANLFSDGIHYTAAGTAQRNARFADALATAYPNPSPTTPRMNWIA